MVRAPITFSGLEIEATVTGLIYFSNGDGDHGRYIQRENVDEFCEELKSLAAKIDSMDLEKDIYEPLFDMKWNQMKPHEFVEVLGAILRAKGWAKA